MKGPAKVSAVVATALSAGVLGSGVAFAGWFEAAPTVTARKLRTAAMPGFESRPGVQANQKKKTVAVQWFAQRLVPGVPIQRYVVTRYNTVTGAHTEVCGSQVTTAKCTDTDVPVGSWVYTVQTAHYRWRGPESHHSDPVTIAGVPAVAATTDTAVTATPGTAGPAESPLLPSPTTTATTTPDTPQPTQTTASPTLPPPPTRVLVTTSTPSAAATFESFPPARPVGVEPGD